MDKIFESVEKIERRMPIDWSLPALSRAWTFAYHDRRMFSSRDPWMLIGTQMLPRFRRIHIYQSIDNDVETIFTTFTAPISIRVILLWCILLWCSWACRYSLVLEEFNESRRFCDWLIIFTRTIHFSSIKTCSPFTTLSVFPWQMLWRTTLLSPNILNFAAKTDYFTNTRLMPSFP